MKEILEQLEALKPSFHINFRAGMESHEAQDSVRRMTLLVDDVIGKIKSLTPDEVEDYHESNKPKLPATTKSVK